MKSGSKNLSILYSLCALLLYILSDFITKKYLHSTSILDISIMRFAVGLPLIIFLSTPLLKDRHAIGFAIVNTVNSMAGVYALTSGSLAGFAIASQMRPLFVSGFGILFFGALYSRKIIKLLLVAFVASVFVFSRDTDLHQTANIFFVITVILQSASFAAFGSHHTNRDVLGFTGLYNLVGFLTCLFLRVVFWRETAIDFDAIGYSVCNALIALAASLLVILGYRTKYKVQASAINYLRLPISLVLASTFFNETVTIVTAAGSLFIIAIVYEIGRSKVEPEIGPLLDPQEKRL
ncbi:hypothetical protein [Microvirga sp. Mcv34]|uniref:hypothetical protein n=1 Tax=Microvirga sp. Mcv34 TaxID=2926016 RepID=UPI0021C8E834|nr:hypothetical protein [Microvirga sp. Mcv34]